jgi:hypothetical protein
MFVHRLLDVVFRTLDAIDAVRARVDAVLGHEAQPPSTWPPDAPSSPAARPADAAASSSSSPAAASAPASPPSSAKPVTTPKPSTRAPRKVVARDASASKAGRKPASSSTTAADATTSSSTKGNKAARADTSTKAAGAEGRAKKPAPTTKKKAASTAGATTTSESATPRDAAGVGRKGSVDRSGRDLDSARARAVENWLRGQGRPLVADDATLDGKRTLARVVWAVACAEDAGSEQGLTAADASAFLSSAAGVEVFTTNVGRTFRDESTLFVETIPDGRSKRYKLTAAGRARLAEVRTR